MNRRQFTAATAGASLLPLASAATTSRQIEVALLTHQDGPHLSAYIGALAQTPEASAVYLCDASGATVDAVRKGLGAKLAGTYRSADELFSARKPALALITMEAKLAPPVIDAALKAGCHVMAEKPACVRVADFEPLVAKATASKRHLMLALANRTDPVMLEARRLVLSGAIGKVYGMDLHTIADQTRLTRPAYHKSWTAQKARSGGGHLIWLGIHWLDLAMFIGGSPITQVAGFSGNVGGQPIDTEDSAAVSFRFANGTFGNLTSGYYLDKGKHLYIKVWGSQGWLELNHGTSNPLGWYSTSGSGTPQVRRYTPPAGPAGYDAFVAHVVRAAGGSEAPILTPEDSLRALRAVFASYRAAESGRTQEV